MNIDPFREGLRSIQYVHHGVTGPFFVENLPPFQWANSRTEHWFRSRIGLKILTFCPALWFDFWCDSHSWLFLAHIVGYYPTVLYPIHILYGVRHLWSSCFCFQDPTITITANEFNCIASAIIGLVPQRMAAMGILSAVDIPCHFNRQKLFQFLLWSKASCTSYATYSSFCVPSF